LPGLRFFLRPGQAEAIQEIPRHLFPERSAVRSFSVRFSLSAVGMESRTAAMRDGNFRLTCPSSMNRHEKTRQAAGSVEVMASG